MSAAAEAWLVVGECGRRSVYLDRTHALLIAAEQHGVVYPLVAAEDDAGDRQREAAPDPRQQQQAPQAARGG